MGRLTSACVFAAALLALAGCAEQGMVDDASSALSERHAFREAKDADTSEAWSFFLREYPSSSLRGEAQAGLQAAAWREASQTNTAQGFLAFLRAWPDHPKDGEARDRCRTLLAAGRGSEADYLQYLSDYPNDPQAEDLRQQLEQLRFSAARDASDPMQVELFLEEYPGTTDAAQLLASVSQGGSAEAVLRRAASRSRADIVGLLVAHDANLDVNAQGAEVNSYSTYGHDALMLAAQSGSLDTVKELLSDGADPTLKDSAGETALDLARRSGSSDVVSLLEAACPVSCYVAKAGAKLTDVSGGIITRLPLGTRVRGSREAGAYVWISIGKGLQGWMSKSDLSVARPDMFAPIIQLLSKRLDGAELDVKGVVYSDKPLQAVAFGGQALSRASFEIEKGNYRNAFPFEGSMIMTPGANAVVSAQDTGGLSSMLTVSVRGPVLDYTPAYAQLRILRHSSIYAEAQADANVIGPLSERTVVVSIGHRGDWYALQGGGWVAAADAEPLALDLPATQATAEVTLQAQSSETSAIVSKPSDVDADIPSGPANPNAVAVVIANRDYSKAGVPAVEYALNDGAVMKSYLHRLFGVSQENIIYDQDASKGDFEGIFGNDRTYKGRLYDFVSSVGAQSDVIVYYVGHGAPAADQKAYLVPVDASPQQIDIQGYPLAQLYANLSQLKARSVTVILDACFSGETPNGPLIQNASPLILKVKAPTVPPDFTVMTAAGSDQMASWDGEQRHSLFTYYLLKGLHDRAGASSRRDLTVEALGGYVRDRVQRAARRLYSRDQTPRFIAPPKRVLVDYSGS